MLVAKINDNFVVYNKLSFVLVFKIQKNVREVFEGNEIQSKFCY